MEFEFRNQSDKIIASGFNLFLFSMRKNPVLINYANRVYSIMNYLD